MPRADPRDDVAAPRASHARAFGSVTARLQESVGVDDEMRVLLADRLEQIQPDASAGAVLPGLLVGLSAAQLQTKRT